MRLTRSNSGFGTTGRRLRGLRATLLLPLALAGGCMESDSFLMDPSIVGRWEHTPTTVPILTRIGSIEGPEDEFVEFSDVTPADLVPEVSEHRLGPGDRITLTVFDIPEEGRPTQYERFVDVRGFIDIPQLGSLYVNGLTAREAEGVVRNAMRDLIADPLAYVVVDQARAQRFSVFGAVQAPGQYLIPVAEYRLLEGLTSAGGFSESSEYVYVIRQVPLTAAARGRPVAPPAVPDRGATPTPPPGDRLIDIIDELSKPPTPAPAPRPSPTPAPAPDGSETPQGSPALLQPAGPGGAPIDLIDRDAPAASQQPAPTATQPPAGEGTWVNVQGRWVRVRQPEAAAPERLPGMPVPGEATVAQRVIRIPMQRLAMGDARYNIIVRPGDIVRVPPLPSGTIFIGGQVPRVGAYGLSERITLTRALTSAGGLTAISIPERVDLVRMVGPDRQGIVRLNLRAIEEGTHPDVYLRPNDRINVGTNFWATPLAVIRTGLRASYGFGFVADRNFGNDIFGPPPDARLQ